MIPAGSTAGSITATLSCSFGDTQSAPVQAVVMVSNPPPMTSSGGGGGAFDLLTWLFLLGLVGHALSNRTLHGPAAAIERPTSRHADHLTDYELETVARACRALAHVERKAPGRSATPALRGPVQQRAQCAAALAERFERASKNGLRMNANRAPDALKGGVMWGWVKHCFANYAVFNGRAGRPEYWWFYPSRSSAAS